MADQDKSTLEIIEAPFDGGNDFFKPSEPGHAPAAEEEEPADEEEAAGGEEAPEGEGEGGEPSEADALRAELATLRERLDRRDAEAERQHRAATANELMARYDEMVASGQLAAAQQVRQQIIAVQQGAPATSGAVPPNAPAGHWSHNIADQIKEWAASRPWLGVDVKRTDAVRRAGELLDPVKFATRESYFAAIEKAAEDAVKPAVATPKAAPVPRSTPAARTAPAGQAAGGKGEFTSISQLPTRERHVAENMIRLGGLTEAEYLKSFNAVRAASRQSGGRRK